MNRETHRKAKEELERIIKLTGESRAGVFADTIVSPSFTTSVAQIIQVPGVAGMDNNGIILEFAKEESNDEQALTDIISGTTMALESDFNILVLRSTPYNCGYHRSIHIWLTQHQLGNANLMILLAYIMLGHPEWSKSEISVFAAMPPETSESRQQFLRDLIREGRLPISEKNVQVLPYESWEHYETIVTETSGEADLVMMGFTPEQFQKYKAQVFTRFLALRDMVFVCSASNTIELTTPQNSENTP